jgi:hypothetical protein
MTSCAAAADAIPSVEATIAHLRMLRLASITSIRPANDWEPAQYTGALGRGEGLRRLKVMFSRSLREPYRAVSFAADYPGLGRR